VIGSSDGLARRTAKPRSRLPSSSTRGNKPDPRPFHCGQPRHQAPALAGVQQHHVFGLAAEPTAEISGPGILAVTGGASDTLGQLVATNTTQCDFLGGGDALSISGLYEPGRQLHAKLVKRHGGSPLCV